MFQIVHYVGIDPCGVRVFVTKYLNLFNKFIYTIRKESRISVNTHVSRFYDDQVQLDVV